ncbi:MAG TPA: sugar phosphate nucleotidyltransferase, partial [Immundisolibacter sp.]|nr:sugar phosphate nucleotidyltransferase [Immundisolibacter sp.]
VGCFEVPVADACSFGVMGVDADLRIRTFIEKPAQPAPMPGRGDVALCSMGIYVFNTRFLFEQLYKDADMRGSKHDFGRDVIPGLLERYRAFAYPFVDPDTGGQAYWRDVGTLDAYYAANMDLVGVTPELNLYDTEWPIWTLQEQVPPAKFVFDDDGRRGMAVDSVVSGGCIISGATVRKSLLFTNVHIEAGAQVEECVVLPQVKIGEGCRIRRAIVERGCVIPPGMVIGEDPAADAQRFSVTPGGVTLVIPEMLGQALHHAR